MPNALVTGASSGIGRALASRLARAGHQLVLVARGRDRLEQLAADLRRDHGVGATALPADLSDPGAPVAIAAELERRGVAVDVLVNSAGGGRHGPFADSALEDQLAMIRLNVGSLTALTRLLLPGMVARGRGRIANLASTAAFQPGPMMAVYYATKAYVLSFSEALAHELSGTGVRVTAVCPGPTLTGFQQAAGLARRRIPGPFVVGVERVADVAYRGIMKGQRVVVPGVGNRLAALASQLGPRRVVTAVVGWVNGRGAGSGERYPR